MGLRVAVRDDAGGSDAGPLDRSRSPAPAELFGYVAIGVVLTAVVMLSSRGYFTPDIKPEVYLNPLRRLAYDLSAWQPDPQLGVGNYNNGLAPVSAVTAALHAVGLSPELIARLLRLALLGLGAWGAVRFFRAAAPSSDVPAARLAMAAVFLFNPYAIVGGSTLAVLLPYCVFPWQLLVLLRALQVGHGWKWPSAFALTFFAMSGMNVAAVPVLQLVALPTVALYVRRRTGQPWRLLLLTIGRCVLLSVLVSAYWLVPSIAAFTWGSTVASGSETVAGISTPSSFAEVLRGLGLWPMYGRNVVSGPWTPGFVPYLANAAVVAGTFLLVVVAAVGARLSRDRARFLAVTTLAVVAVVMVSAHPPGHPSPVGRLFVWVFDSVPGAVALRTTNKAGAGLALALALLVALAAAELAARIRTPNSRLVAVLAVAGIVVVAGWPAFSGQSYVGRWKIPAYWTSAAHDLDKDHTDSRVWFLPGQVLAHYRWNTDGPDDVNLSLLDRPSLVRTVLPVSSAATTNLLAGADTSLQEGRLSGHAISVLSRYLGVDQVLLRNDTVWEDARGGRPAVIQPQVDGDPGLKLVATYGSLGQNTASLTPGLDPAADSYEKTIEPLRRYDVLGADGIVRTESPTGTVLIDGDGFAVPGLIDAGLLEGQSFRYVGGLTDAALTQLLGPSQRLVLTDSNRRRAADEHHLTNAYGPLLTAQDTPATTRALYGSPDQTVAHYDGIKNVTATEFGSPFDVSARGAPELAVDGDPKTAWTFGAFGTATAQSLTITLDHARNLGSVNVLTASGLGPVQISELRLQAGGVTRVSDVDPDGVARFAMTGVNADKVRLSVTKTTGSGFNLVGLAEVTIPGVTVTKVAQLPTGTAQRLQNLPPAAQTKLAQTPLDVLLQRERGTQPDWDEERTLQRDFSLPDARVSRSYGLVRQTSDASTVPKPDADGCVKVATLDDQPLRVRLLQSGVSPNHAVLFEGCADASLAAGTHQLRGTGRWAIDTLVLRDHQGDKVTSRPATPTARTTHRTNSSITVKTPAGKTPYLLVLGQSVDTRWQARMDGRSMGNPLVVDGYSAAWEVTDPGAHTFTFTYTPQRLVDWTRAFSGMVVALLFVLAFRRQSSVELSPQTQRANQPVAPVSRRRRTVEGVVIAVVCGLCGGLPLAVVGLGLGVAHATGRPGGRRLLAVAVGLLALVPVAWIVGNRDIWGQITPALVVDTPWPAWLAAAALACMVVGVVEDDRTIEDGPEVAP